MDLLTRLVGSDDVPWRRLSDCLRSPEPVKSSGSHYTGIHWSEKIHYWSVTHLRHKCIHYEQDWAKYGTLCLFVGIYARSGLPDPLQRLTSPDLFNVISVLSQRVLKENDFIECIQRFCRLVLRV